MNQHWSYDILKHYAINEKNAQDNLEDLKSMLRDDIGSARNMGRIKTIDDLLDCLERHDALSEYNIEPLREIVDQLECDELEKGLIGYCPPQDKTAYDEPYNQYREQRLADKFRVNLNISGQQNAQNSGVPVDDEFNCCHQPPAASPPAPAHVPTPFPQVLSDKKRAAIYKMIAENIGKFWRALGRELEIRQGQLDEVEMQYPRDLVSRVHQMLHVFEEDESHDPKQHVLILCRALEHCRRKDLRRKVENIMSH